MAQLVEWWEVMWEVMGSCVLCNVYGLYIYIYIYYEYINSSMAVYCLVK